jgi:hypothetical protein
MASGDAARFERARPLMEAFAQTFFFLGETGRDEVFYATLGSLERAADTRVPRLGEDG